MQRLTIQAATRLSAQTLYGTLSEFHPEVFSVDDPEYSLRS